MAASDRRPMTPEERELLDFLLTDAIPDVATLRAQATDAMVTGSCSCGCPTVDLAPAAGAPSWDAGRFIGRVAASAFSRPRWPQAQLLLHVPGWPPGRARARRCRCQRATPGPPSAGRVGAAVRRIGAVRVLLAGGRLRPA